MKSSRGCAAVCLALAMPCGIAAAQDKWPSKPIRMVVPFPNTAASDALSRILGERLGQLYGQQFVVDNRPGAGGLIGSELIRNAAPDGYTFGMVGQPHLSNVLMREPKPYDPLKDFAAVGLVGVTPNVIVVGKGVEAKTIPDSDRARESEARRIELRLRGRGKLVASRGRALHIQSEDRRRSRAVSRGRRQPQRVARGRHSVLCLSVAGDRRRHSRRTVPRAGSGLAETRRGAAGASDERRSGLPSGTSRNPGSASWRRAPCRASSSRGSTPTP